MRGGSVAKKQHHSKEEVDAEVRIAGFRSITNIAITALRTAGLCFLAWAAVRIMDDLAGKTTLASIGVSIKVLGNVYISQAAAWIFGFSGVGYGISQRRLRHKNIERLSPGVREREKALDPKRTSSRLTERGRTHPKDEV